MKIGAVKSFCLGVLFLCSGAQAQYALDTELTSLGQLQQLAEFFGDDLVQGPQAKALENLARYGSGEYVTPKAKAPASKVTGFEVVGHHEVGESVYRIDLLEKHTEGARGWSLLFYRSKLHWQLLRLELSDDLSEIFSCSFR